MIWWWKRKRPSSEADTLFSSATRARIIEGGVARGVALGKRVALELSGSKARELVERLQVVPVKEPFHCMCLGDWGIELFEGDAPLTTVGLHHGRSIRIDGRSSDELLQDGEGLLRFLADQGLKEPLEAFEEDRQAADRSAKARKRWLRATPEPLREFLPKLEGDSGGRLLRPGDPDVHEALARLDAADGDSARALLAWYSAGLGPWSGFPSYEGVASALLLELGTERVIQAAETARSEGELFGAARFLARWDAQPKERRMVSDTLATRLRKVTRSHGDADACARLEAGLAPLEAKTGGPCIGRSDNVRDFAFVVAVDVPKWQRTVVALDNPELLLLAPGERRVLCNDLKSVGAIAAHGRRVVISRLDKHDLVEVDLETGAVETLCSTGPEVRCLAITSERVVWIERGETSVVRELGRKRPWAEQELHAWDLRIPGPAPIWGRPHAPAWSMGANYQSEIVTVDAKGKVRRIARFTGDESYVYPRFDADARHLACTTGREVTVVDRESGKQSKLGLARRVQGVALDGDTLWVIAWTEDRYGGELLRVDLPTGAIDKQLSYKRMRYHQEELSIGATQVAWNLGGEALCVKRS